MAKLKNEKEAHEMNECTKRWSHDCSRRVHFFFAKWNSTFLLPVHMKVILFNCWYRRIIYIYIWNYPRKKAHFPGWSQAHQSVRKITLSALYMRWTFTKQIASNFFYWIWPQIRWTKRFFFFSLLLLLFIVNRIELKHLIK